MKSWFIAVPLVLTLALVVVGVFSNGHTFETEDQDLSPYAVLLRSQGSGREFCSGVLVGPHTVLTARHCLKDEHDLDIILEFSATKRGATQITSRPTKIRLPAGDQRAFPLLDLAEVEFAGNLPETVRPIPRAAPDVFIAENVTLKVVGFGRDGTAQQSEVKYQRDWNGDRIFGLFSALTPASGGPCFGDSGGGVFVRVKGRWQVVGLVTGTWGIFGDEKRTCEDNVALFTDLRWFSTWLSGGSLPKSELRAAKGPSPMIDMCQNLHLGTSNAAEWEAWYTVQSLLNAVAIDEGKAQGEPPVQAFLDCTVGSAWITSFAARGGDFHLRGIADLKPLRQVDGLQRLTLSGAGTQDWSGLVALATFRHLTIIGNRYPIPVTVLANLPAAPTIDLQYVTGSGSSEDLAALRAAGRIVEHEVTFSERIE